MAPSRTPPGELDPLASAFPVRRALPAFLFSTAFHAGLLLLLATISFTVAKQVQKINVKIIDRSAEANKVDDTDTEGAPSLKDIAGTLRPVIAMPRNTGSVAGPSSGPAVANVRAPEMPHFSIGPSVGALGSQPGSLDISRAAAPAAVASATCSAGFARSASTSCC
jgi:hypothetical protein